MGFWDFGGLKWTVVQHREEDVVEKTCGGFWGSGNLMPRLARPIAKSACGEGWGSKNDPPQNKMLK